MAIASTTIVCRYRAVRPEAKVSFNRTATRPGRRLPTWMIRARRADASGLGSPLLSVYAFHANLTREIRLAGA